MVLIEIWKELDFSLLFRVTQMSWVSQKVLQYRAPVIPIS